MSLVIALGSNLGDSIVNLKNARLFLEKDFHLIAASRIYTSRAIEYENQPDFLNQVLEFQLPIISPKEVLEKLLQLEKKMGRERLIPKGPRIIDLDIIFWGKMEVNSDQLTIPHPSWNKRSFVVKPLQELPFFQTIEKCFTIPKSFEIDAFPL